jgi:hypothetical protein
LKKPQTMREQLQHQNHSALAQANRVHGSKRRPRKVEGNAGNGGCVAGLQRQAQDPAHYAQDDVCNDASEVQGVRIGTEKRCVDWNGKGT